MLHILPLERREAAGIKESSMTFICRVWDTSSLLSKVDILF